MFYKIKVKIFKILNYLLNKINLSLDVSINQYKFDEIIHKLKPYDLGHELIRVGSVNDGGYLVPNILDQIHYCFSPGVGSKIDFEKNLLDYNIKSFLADGTIKKSIELREFDFENKNLASYNSNTTITLENWVNSKVQKNFNLLLQMDVESFEYEIISSTPEEILKMFKIMVIEFHYIEKLNHYLIFNIFSQVLNKILLNFEIAHVHPNNCQGTFYVNNEKLPTALEVTFLRKDLCKYKKNINTLPNKLDSRNIESLPEVFLSEKWYN